MHVVKNLICMIIEEINFQKLENLDLRYATFLFF